MIRLDRKSRKYFDLYRRKMEKSRITLDLVDAPHLMYGDLPASGLFIEVYEEDRLAELTVAVGRPVEEWFPIFVHETSHMDQFLESSKYWHNIYIIVDGERIEGIDILDRHIAGDSFPPEVLWEAVSRAVAVEWDCERRVVEKIKQFDLPINIEEYTKKANGYLYLYRMAAQERAWSIPGRAPYSVPEVWEVMPNRLLSLRNYRFVPKKYQELYKKYCFSK